MRNTIWNNIGDKLSQQEAEDYISFFYERDFISEREAKLMKSVVNDKILNISQRDNIRSQILKSMLIALVD